MVVTVRMCAAWRWLTATWFKWIVDATQTNKNVVAMISKRYRQWEWISLIHWGSAGETMVLHSWMLRGQMYREHAPMASRFVQKVQLLRTPSVMTRVKRMVLPNAQSQIFCSSKMTKSILTSLLATSQRNSMLQQLWSFRAAMGTTYRSRRLASSTNRAWTHFTSPLAQNRALSIQQSMKLWDASRRRTLRKYMTSATLEVVSTQTSTNCATESTF